MTERYVICDIEATGLEEDREIIEIALITFEDGKVTDVYSTLLNPLRPLSTQVQDLTMISSRDLLAAPKFYDVASALKDRLEGKVFVAHNVDFDLGLLRKKFHELGDSLEIKSYCTLRGSQELIPGMLSYSLEALGHFFRIKNREAHRALSDAEATLELFKELQNLRYRYVPRDIYHSRHEKLLKSLSRKAGILTLKDSQGKTLMSEPTTDLFSRAQALLKIRPENRWLLERVESITSQQTGSALLANLQLETKKKLDLKFKIILLENASGEKSFALKPFRDRSRGHWFFSDKKTGLAKLRRLQSELQDSRYIYRDGAKTKDEIVENNLKVDQLLKEAQFPTDHLVILGEGRSLGERSVVLIRDGRVRGFGFTAASAEEVEASPDSFIDSFDRPSLVSDLVAIRYLRELRNQRKKSEAWRSIPRQ